MLKATLQQWKEVLQLNTNWFRAPTGRKQSVWFLLAVADANS